MNINDFSIIGNIQYGDFPLIEYMYNEIVLQDTYGLRKVKERFGNKIKTIVDIGGNLGVFSVFAREIFPTARIVSLEALHDTHLSLTQNTKQFNIETYNIALGDGSALYLKQCLDHSGANQFRKDNSADLTYAIKSKTLKNIFNELKIEAPFLIKIDIEGSEMFLYEDETCIDILRASTYFTMEYHNVNMLGYEVNKEKWDDWLAKIFIDFDIDGLGGDASGATYRIMQNG
jgi:FkbM family methyltransferase